MKTGFLLFFFFLNVSFRSLNILAGSVGGVCAHLKRNPVLPFRGACSVQELLRAVLPAAFIHEKLTFVKSNRIQVHRSLMLLTVVCLSTCVRFLLGVFRFAVDIRSLRSSLTDLTFLA